MTSASAICSRGTAPGTKASLALSTHALLRQAARGYPGRPGRGVALTRGCEVSYGWVAGLVRRGVLAVVMVSVSWLVPARSWASSSR